LPEFGLILFVFTIGLQIGPGFFASLRDQGLALNGLAAAIVVGGGLLTLIFAMLFGIAFGAAAGLFSGATTNTPALGAAQQAGLKADERWPTLRLFPTPSLIRWASWGSWPA
jgi:putative transport protein